MKNETIAVAMSGGVDSSAVAALLCSQGHNVVGLTMQLWNQRRLSGKGGIPERAQGRCCSIDDVYDARRVAQSLRIPYYVVNHEDSFEHDVVRPFVEEYLSGRTPIPCSRCNTHVKFEQLINRARQIGADRLATGHYARSNYDPEQGRWLLRQATDKTKDQTYFLFGLTQEQLGRSIFPIGHMTKPAVREVTRSCSASVADKAESQEICFIPDGDYKNFIAGYLEEQQTSMGNTSGNMVTPQGKVVGHHEGIHNFTVGQRKGLGVSTGSPLYVLKINPEGREIVVGSEDQLYSSTLEAAGLNWISVEQLHRPLRVNAKIRHRHEPSPALVEMASDTRVRVTFDQPQRAITPGQAVVFYQEDVVVGGGWIQ